MSELLRPVTNPAEQAVTDPTVLSALVRTGQDPQDVKFVWDYCGSYPVTKKYVNQRTGERILVSNRLPMACPDNSLILPLLEPGSGKWYIGNNLFSGEVSTSGRIALTPVVTQPNGLTPGDEVVWEPILYLDDVEVEPLSAATRLEVDPVNGNYIQNVIEWDYGICVRRVRVIEGRLCERWYFNESPGGTVRIVHNHTGQFKLGPFAVDVDTEQVTLAQFSEAQFPLTVSATLEVYPDADPESATFDGNTAHATEDTTWAALRGAAGNTSSDGLANDQHFAYLLSGASADTWYWISRGIFLFDTSPLPDAAIISLATFSLYWSLSFDRALDEFGNQPCHVCSSNPASNTGVANGDFDSLGDTSFGAFSGVSASQYYDVNLNASGIAAISKTGVTKFGTRVYGDLINTSPTWAASKKAQYKGMMSEAGAGLKPKLVITYTTGWQGKIGGVVNPEKVGGIGKGDIKKIGGV